MQKLRRCLIALLGLNLFFAVAVNLGVSLALAEVIEGEVCYKVAQDESTADKRTEAGVDDEGAGIRQIRLKTNKAFLVCDRALIDLEVLRSLQPEVTLGAGQVEGGASDGTSGVPATGPGSGTGTGGGGGTGSGGGGGGGSGESNHAYPVSSQDGADEAASFVPPSGVPPNRLTTRRMDRSFRAARRPQHVASRDHRREFWPGRQPDRHESNSSSSGATADDGVQSSPAGPGEVNAPDSPNNDVSGTAGLFEEASCAVPEPSGCIVPASNGIVGPNDAKTLCLAADTSICPSGSQTGKCAIVGPGTYTYKFVRVLNGGTLFFKDNDPAGTKTEFLASSILVE